MPIFCNAVQSFKKFILQKLAFVRSIVPCIQFARLFKVEKLPYFWLILGQIFVSLLSSQSGHLQIVLRSTLVWNIFPLHSCNVSWKINLLLTTTSTCLAV
jgi:hypothetical protein